MVKDPNILLSLINTKLRDNYSSLEDLCDDLDYDQDEIKNILDKAGFHYDKEKNQFKSND